MPIARPTRQPSKPGRAVVAEARDHAAERLGAVVEERSPGVVLEARERLAGRRVELALEQHVADHPPLAGDRLVREERRRPASRSRRGRGSRVRAAGSRRRRRAGRRRRRRRRGAPRARGEVGRDEGLLAILAAADVEEIVRTRRRAASPSPIGVDLELVAARSGAPREHGDVAAVGVDVQVVGVEVADADLHDAALPVRAA